MLFALIIPILVLNLGVSDAQQHITIQNFTTPTGTFASPFYPANYAANSSYRWYIIEKPGLYITLNFESFAVEGYSNAPCKYDWVIVAEGEENVNTMKDCTVPPTASTILGLYCNYHTPSETLHLASNIAAVQFCSDEVIQDMGFNITFTTSNMPMTTTTMMPTSPSTPPPYYCGYPLTVKENDTASILSPNYPPGPYPPNSNCTWIVTSNAPSLKITSKFFDVEGYSNNCYYDRVTITGPDHITTVYCMVRGPNLEFHESNYPYTVTIGFVSDDVIQYPGFELTLSGLSGQPVDPKCNNTFILQSTTESFTLNSPGWPYDYGNNQLCMWQIINNLYIQNYSIQFQFVSFNTEQNEDTLTVVSTDNVARVFDGYIPPNKVAIFPTSQLTATFKTDSNVIDKGFDIVVTLVPTPFSCPVNTFRCRSDPQCIPMDEVCDHISQCLDASDETAQVCQLRTDCGISTVQPNINVPHGISFIVNGTQAKPYSWPWVVGIYRYNLDNVLCGGTIIMPRWILTSARCVYNDNGNPYIFSVKAGSYETRATNEHEQILNVTSIITHPEFNPKTYENDVALLLLSENITFNDWVNAACLPHGNATVEPNQVCVMTGWGSTLGTGNNTVLRQMLAVTIPNDVCNDTQHYAGKIYDTEICAGDPLGYAGICQQDFGGPLACPNAEGRYYVQGVASQNDARANCVTANQPGIFSRTLAFMQFISETMEEYNKQ